MFTPENIKSRLDEIDGMVSVSITNWAHNLGAQPSAFEVDEITTEILERVLETLVK